MDNQSIGILLSQKKWNKLLNNQRYKEVNEYVKSADEMNIPILLFPIEYVNPKDATTTAFLIENGEKRLLSKVKIPRVIYRPRTLWKKRNIKKWRNLLLDRDFFIISEHHLLKRKYLIQMLSQSETLSQYLWDDKKLMPAQIPSIFNKEGIQYFVETSNNRNHNFIEVYVQEGSIHPMVWISEKGRTNGYSVKEAKQKLRHILEGERYSTTKPLGYSFTAQPAYYLGFVQKNEDNKWNITSIFTEKDNTLFSWNEAIDIQFPHLNIIQKQDIQVNLSKAVLSIIEHIHLYYPGIHELGIQFLLDKQGHPYFHSVKTKHYILKHLYSFDQVTWANILTYPLNLASHYLQSEAKEGE